MIPRKINVKIQGQDKPFEAEVSDYDTLITLKNKLYLSHEKIADLAPYINGKEEIKQWNTRVLDLVIRYPDFVYLMFGSANAVVAEALAAKSIGMSDQTIKPDYMKTFTANSSIDSVRSIKIEDRLKKVQLNPGNKIVGNSSRITDLTHEQLLTLLNILKVQNGRYMDQKMQIVTSNKQSVSYQIKQQDFSDIIEDKGISHFFHNQSITEQSKEVYEQGFKDKQLKNKIPYLFAFSFEQEETYSRLEKGIQKTNYTFVQHCFPRGEVNLVTVQTRPSEQLVGFFDNKEVNYENILSFYRKYGQFVIKKFTVGLKRVCSQKILESMSTKSSQQVQNMATMAATRIRQYMLQTSTEIAVGDKKAETRLKSDQQLHYDIKAIGGAIQYCENVALWKESVNTWELWRIIAVNQVESTEGYLPGEVRERVYDVLNQRMRAINQLTSKKPPEITLAPKFTQSKQTIRMESSFQVIATFKQKIYQILPLDKDSLILIFIDRAIKFDLTKMQTDFKIDFRDSAKCFYQRQPGYMTACIHNGQVYIATQLGIVKLNFTDHTLKIVVEGNWRQSTLLLSYKDKLYTNGWRGIYQIDPKTGDYFVKIGGDWRFYTGTCIKNNAYLFYWNVYCLDLDSMIYSKVTMGLWNQFWGDFTYPTSSGSKLWQLYRNNLYCFQGSSYSPVEFYKDSVAISNFTSRSLCYHKGSLFLSNFDHNEHLMRIPL